MLKEEVDKLTVQQALDYSISKLVLQGSRCIVNGDCLYGDENGRHCAVGWLLDDTNEKLMEHIGSINTLDLDDESIPNLIKNNKHLFLTLQDFHDSDDYGDKRILLGRLTDDGIDTITNPDWVKWVEMGTRYYD